MKKGLTEEKFVFYTVAAIVLLMTIHFFHSQLTTLYDPDNYVSFHTLLELFSIAISVSIFSYGWKTFLNTRSRTLLFLALTFFTVGSIDLLHTLSFKGMPHFITESSIAKGTWFWVVARVTEAVLMVSVLLLNDKQLKSDPRKKLLFLCILYTFLITFFVISFEKSLPLLVVEGEGTTLLKNMIEYFVSFLQFLSIVISLYFYYSKKNQHHLYTALAFTFLFLSELVFTIYRSVFDIDNFTGHLFKVFGYYFIMKGFYLSFQEEEKFVPKIEEAPKGDLKRNIL